MLMGPFITMNANPMSKQMSFLEFFKQYSPTPMSKAQRRIYNMILDQKEKSAKILFIAPRRGGWTNFKRIWNKFYSDSK